MKEPEYHRMIAARDAVRARLNGLQDRLRRDAARSVNSPAAYRGDSGWRKTDEAAYQDSLARLQHAHRSDIGALTAKLDRQQAAIRAFIIRNPS